MSYYSDIDSKCADTALKRHKSFIRFEANAEMPIFCLGMVFLNVQEVRDVIAKYAIKQGLDVRLKK